MFEYFPRNYTWSLAVMMTLTEGGHITDVDDACRPLIDLQDRDDIGDAWTQSWLKVANRCETQGHADEAAGRRRSAAAKLKRAALYHIMAERMLPIADTRHLEMYNHALELFRNGVRLAGDRTEFVTLETVQGKVAAIWCPAATGGPAPAVITLNGLDAFKEFFYLGDTRPEFLERGISLLLVDQPGAGETLRKFGQPHRYDIEVTTGAAIDWLSRRQEVDADRIGLIGPSLGGYYGIRSAAREPRLACTALLGAIWDFGAKVRRRAQGISIEQLSVPEWAATMRWFFGATDDAGVIAATERFKVEDIIADVSGPLLIVHGEEDRQIPVADARKVYAAAVNVKDLELRIFTREETSSEHCGIDNQLLQIQYIADWMEQRLLRPKP